MKKIPEIIIMFTVLLAIDSCQENTSPKMTSAVLSGVIKSSINENIVYPVFIYSGDSLLTTTDESGEFSFKFDNGSYELLFSAEGYEDETVTFTIDGENLNKNIALIENSETGRVYGEFQDLELLNQKIEEDSSIADWSEKEIMDGVTGATMQEITYGAEIPYRLVFMGDSLKKYADGYGQYWLEIQCGTYPLTGKCDGFSSETKTVKVTSGSKVYLNFYLSPESN
ncbi:MAG: carboxypeptidase-like regulatory domain-containing protein [Ignavibacteria bacterium]|jgi:hypothetical protein